MSLFSEIMCISSRFLPVSILASRGGGGGGGYVKGFKEQYEERLKSQ